MCSFIHLMCIHQSVHQSGAREEETVLSIVLAQPGTLVGSPIDSSLCKETQWHEQAELQPACDWVWLKLKSLCSLHNSLSFHLTVLSAKTDRGSDLHDHQKLDASSENPSAHPPNPCHSVSFTFLLPIYPSLPALRSAPTCCTKLDTSQF